MAIKNVVEEKGTQVAVENKAVGELKPAETKRPQGAVNLQAQGESILAAKSEEEKANIGSNSKDIEFLNLVTNPWQPVSRKKDGDVFKGEESVGAIFKNVGTEPITIMEVPNKTYKVMDGDFDKVTERSVAPGETFVLNYIETAMLLTRDEYGCRATGGDKVVSYSTQVSKKDPTGIPTTKLNLKGSSIKDLSISIADVDANGNKTIKDEFKEKFEIFSTRGTRGKRSASASGNKAKVNYAGLAVQAMFQAKIK
ncbi:hypothetical protein [Bacillus toyonensis]|uniref:hypothetical protein n=1 Tax=Bacillus toyonensis TaxID=155322 RepID=UPI000BF256FF|nr:hypothetical protein [Bacillus toyonensis]PGF05101.1 hypothetical protein COM61_01345 [Bacillus toyonensis]